MNGIELQDREFFAAIREAREPNASLAQCLPAMQTLDRLERQLAGSERSRSATPAYLERQPDVVLGQTGQRRGRSAQVIEFRQLQPVSKGSSENLCMIEVNHQEKRTAFQMRRRHNSEYRSSSARVRAGPIVFDQPLIQHAHVGAAKIQALGAGRRHDVRRIADQEELTEAQRLDHKTAQRRNALLDRGPGHDRRGDVRAASGERSSSQKPHRASLQTFSSSPHCT